MGLHEIVNLMFWIAIIGGILWAYWTFLPIPQPWKNIGMFVLVVLCLLLLANRLGIAAEADVLTRHCSVTISGAYCAGS